MTRPFFGGTLIKLGHLATGYIEEPMDPDVAAGLRQELRELAAKVGPRWPAELVTAAMTEWTAMAMAEAYLPKDHPQRGTLAQASAELRHLVTLGPDEVERHAVTHELVRAPLKNVITGLPWGPLAQD